MKFWITVAGGQRENFNTMSVQPKIVVFLRRHGDKDVRKVIFNVKAKTRNQWELCDTETGDTITVDPPRGRNGLERAAAKMVDNWTLIWDFEMDVYRWIPEGLWEKLLEDAKKERGLWAWLKWVIRVAVNYAGWTGFVRSVKRRCAYFWR